MSDNLVERLREPCFERGLDELWIDAQRKEAADRIEELEAKLAKSEAEKFTVGTLTMKHVFRPSGLTDVSDMQAVFDATERGFEELEAKLEKAVEVAEKSIKWLRLYGADVHREAATLTELTGGKDE